ncbi:enoyl-CoA hydratase/carnithine racemase [Bacillus pakistanensis]|uniref:Enoyl-CoA hydratase/carnithine racemase n=1 Tax=Rossellomorea pakistanensis TaxID=992288 RepID=A0ABS2NEY5_9BACI|nr:enoyl-CoA hydratase [Bacillus pakistanensis]MBM7586415.1 enoyl-CoA hydratase/carnithine racemase [Bacillus pakistanensis]
METITSTYETLNLMKENKVAYLTLNRPHALNAMNVLMIRELLQCLKELEKDNEIGILVIKGEGKGFSSGGDIKEMLALGGEEQFFSIMDTINELVLTLYSMKKMTVAGIHGTAAGLGLSLALACDYLICEDDSKLAMNFIGIGLIPDGGGHFHLSERLGVAQAKKLIWNGSIVNGQKALKLSLVDEAAVTGKLKQSIDHYVQQCLQKPIVAMVKTKEIYLKMTRPKLEVILEEEKHAQWLMRQTEDHKEGIQAFVEKRKPVFTGK